MAKSNSNKRRLRRSMKKGGAFLSSDAYANGVYGVPQVAASQNSNVITMNQVRGGALLPLSTSTMSGGGFNNNNSKRGGRVGIEELLVPAGLLVANQLVRKPASFKNKSSKRGRKTYRRRR